MYRVDVKSMICLCIWKFYWKGILEIYKLYVYCKIFLNVIFLS